MFWLPAIGFFLISAGYGAVSDSYREIWESSADQWQIVMLAWLAFLSTNYAQTVRKAATLIILTWSLLVACTDPFIGYYPTWAYVGEPIAWAIMISWIVLRALSRGEKAG